MILENRFSHPAMDGRRFLVIHPLDDVHEKKLETKLRGYLVLMMVMVVYHALDLAGVLGQNGGKTP